MSASTLSTRPGQPAPPNPDGSHEGPRRSRWIVYLLLGLVALLLLVVSAMAAGLVFGSEVAEEEQSSAPVIAEPADDVTTTISSAESVVTTEDANESASTPEAGAESVSTTAAAAEPACSAAGYSSSSDQTGMPEAVAATRAAILASAASCDIDGLVELTAGTFTAGFGGGDPATLWAQAEARGEEPLLVLVRLLDQPYETLESEGGEFYVWPSAFVAGAWSGVSDAERAGLAVIYSEEELAEFEAFGRYIGFRVAIHESGSWVYFVSGD